MMWREDTLRASPFRMSGATRINLGLLLLVNMTALT